MSVNFFQKSSLNLFNISFLSSLFKNIHIYAQCLKDNIVNSTDQNCYLFSLPVLAYTI